MSDTESSPVGGVRTMRGLRWFGDGACLGEDIETGETHMVFRMLPGELARVRCVEHGGRGRRRYVAEELLERSTQRGEVDCEGWHNGCAGCGLLHLNHAEERSYKLTLVREVVERLAGLRAPDVDWVSSDAPGESVGELPDGARTPVPVRRRMRVRLCIDGGRLRMSFGGIDGSQVRVSSCGALAAELQQVMGALATVDVAAGPGPGAVPWPTDAVWLTAQLADDGVLDLYCDATDAWQWGPELARRVGEMSGQTVRWAAAEPEWSTATDRESVKQRWLGEQLVRLKKRGRPMSHVLDGTCGSGGTTLELAAVSDRVLALDVDIRAVRAVAERVGREGLGDRVSVRGGRLDTVLGRLVRDGSVFDGVVLNPMRRSLGEAAMEGVHDVGAGWLVYLAPAPRAAAEDLAVLVQRGWALAVLAAVDTHPGTSRVMMGAVLERTAG